tara:strand:- start:632 stop:1810 length:1179 start_codon:yes stop_codon:yes gene_type:complete
LGRKTFLKILATEFRIDSDIIQEKLDGLTKVNDTVSREMWESSLREALIPPRVKLLRQFNELPDGVKFLVDMRGDLLDWSRDDVELGFLEQDLKSLLFSWFDIGFLELEQITWSAPASLLEKLIDYEAVHEIKGWSDIKSRLALDRRCFAFFHPKMPDEPLIFVWVALVNGMATSIQQLLSGSSSRESSDEVYDTAIFYSISNAQKGLTGINFGNFLIKRVVDKLTQEFSGLKNFSTLSPMPGFLDWLRGRDKDMLQLLESSQIEAIKTLGLDEDIGKKFVSYLTKENLFVESKVYEKLRPILTRLSYHYILNAKRPSGTALDSVAHFHLNNGARVEQINWGADISEKGVRQSAGLMVNYRYVLEEIESNHEIYQSGMDINVSSKVKNILGN